MKIFFYFLSLIFLPPAFGGTIPCINNIQSAHELSSTASELDRSILKAQKIIDGTRLSTIEAEYADRAGYEMMEVSELLFILDRMRFIRTQSSADRPLFDSIMIEQITHTMTRSSNVIQTVTSRIEKIHNPPIRRELTKAQSIVVKVVDFFKHSQCQ